MNSHALDRSGTIACLARVRVSRGIPCDRVDYADEKEREHFGRD